MSCSRRGVHNTEQVAQLPYTVNEKSFVLHDRMSGVHDDTRCIETVGKCKLASTGFYSHHEIDLQIFYYIFQSHMRVTAYFSKAYFLSYSFMDPSEVMYRFPGPFRQFKGDILLSGKL